MTCSECQERIFEGELDQDSSAHIAQCEECRVMQREFALNAAALAELRDEVIPVRVARPRTTWRGVAAVAAAALIAMTIGMYDNSSPIEEPTAPIPPIVATRPPIPAPVLPGPPSEPVMKARRVRSPKPQVEKKAEEPMLVKFLTDDPEVVIYWLIDPVQGEQGL